MLLTPAEIKRKSFESRRNSSFARGGCASSLRACLGARLLLQSCQYPNLSEGADRVGGQLRGVKECPFSGVTKSGRGWRKLPESDARSVQATVTLLRRNCISSSDSFASAGKGLKIHIPRGTLLGTSVDELLQIWRGEGVNTLL